MADQAPLPDIPPPGEVRYIVRQPNSAPPGGWCYKQADTGEQFRGEDSLDILTQKVAHHRTLNGIVHGDPRGDILHFTGAMLIDAGHAAKVETRKPVNRSLADWWAGMKAFKQLRIFQAQNRPLFVSQPVAQARAQVCIDCPMNVVNSRKKVVQEFTDEEMAGMTEGRTTGREAQLHICDVCSCRVATIIHFTGEFLVACKMTGANLARYPANCWKHQANKP